MSSRLVMLERDPADIPDNKAIDSGVTVLAVSLVLVSLLALARMPLNEALLHIVLVTAFSFLLFYGMVEMPRWGTLGKLVWLSAVTAVWISDMTISPVAIYWVFLLFFVSLRAFNDWRGLLFVAIDLAIAIIFQIPTGLTLGGIMGPALSAVVVVAINYAFTTIGRVSRERLLLIDELLSTREQLAESEREAGVAQERERLAHEIHDTVAQNLSSIQMLLHAAERDLGNLDVAEEELEQPLRRMEAARRAASNNLAETRAMIAALTPAGLREASISEALERIAADFAHASDMDIQVETHGEPQKLPMRVEAGLLRIAQGAVSNAVQHSGASRVRVTLTHEPEEIRLDVVDNGVGFDVAAQAGKPAGLGHLGLDAMRSRAAELGGELTIESAPGGPTAISVAVPVDGAVDSSD
ncbi:MULTISPECIES: sensor histidine kinase [Corynebacterium]|uniref:sensor histidine kinase n=1 Tax=Corynebacterium TaxID=1716 RepID=UPI0008A4550D|nr:MULTISPECIES: sensor histidine kinase [Corynebacterium]OFT75215.1 ATPase [Corynebacterium sp. HMSC30G07]PLA12090.1 sensor histidine kinase [Corynebacterium riegelii]QQU84428.1 sensor histidine kinase [Corynebacterium riegelii]